MDANAKRDRGKALLDKYYRNTDLIDELDMKRRTCLSLEQDLNNASNGMMNTEASYRNCEMGFELIERLVYLMYYVIFYTGRVEMRNALMI